MIRLILRDLFPGRSAVGVLRQRVHELERENARLRDQEQTLIEERDDARGDVEKLSAEVDALQKRALRPDPTPGEARMLEIVRANPGALSPDLGRLAWQRDADEARAQHIADSGADYAHGWWNRPLADGDNRISDASRPLSGLFKKSLVRRERCGNTYRYWVSE